MTNKDRVPVLIHRTDNLVRSRLCRVNANPNRLDNDLYLLELTDGLSDGDLGCLRDEYDSIDSDYDEITVVRPDDRESAYSPCDSDRVLATARYDSLEVIVSRAYFDNAHYAVWVVDTTVNAVCDRLYGFTSTLPPHAILTRAVDHYLTHGGLPGADAFQEA